MKKLSVPENICLRWELWRGFGKPELLATCIVTGAAGAGAALFNAVVPGDHSAAVVAALILTLGFCAGFFGKLDGSQSICDFLMRQAAFHREQQEFRYVRVKAAYVIEPLKETIRLPPG